MRETRTQQDSPAAAQDKKISRRETLGALGLVSVTGLSAAKGKLYAKAAIKASLGFEPEPGSPTSG